MVSDERVSTNTLGWSNSAVAPATATTATATATAATAIACATLLLPLLPRRAVCLDISSVGPQRALECPAAPRIPTVSSANTLTHTHAYATLRALSP